MNSNLKTKKSKKLILAVIILIAISSLVAFFIYISKPKQEVSIITTEYNDKFIMKSVKVTGFPQPGYKLELYNEDNSLVFKSEGLETSYNEIKSMYNSDNLRCYLCYGYFVYKTKQQNDFGAVRSTTLDIVNVNEYKSLVPVAKKLFLEHWEWKQYVAEFLVKSNDKDTIELMKQYAKGNFSKEEKEQSRTSNHGLIDMQEFFEKLLKKYNIE